MVYMVPSFDLSDLIAESCVVCVILFAVAIVATQQKVRSKKSNNRKDKFANEELCALCKHLESDLASGGPAKVLSTWRAMHPGKIPSPRALKIVVQAFIDAEPDSLVCEICERMNQHQMLCTPNTVTSLIDIMARAGQTTAMEEFLLNMQRHHEIPASDQINEILLGGFASAGQEEKLNDLVSRILGRISARGYCLLINGLLKNKMTHAALVQMKAMHEQGLLVPPFAVTKLCRVWTEVDNCVPIIDDLEECAMPVTSLAVTILMNDCLKKHDLKAAFRVEKLANSSNIALTLHAYDSFLLLCVSDGDVYAFKLFEELQKRGKPSHGLCVGLIVRCPKSRFCQFADVVADYLRKNNEMDIQAYSALMKVYATCGLYNKACDLYPEILKDGLKLDSVMYGCLMKFAVECGRTELTQELSRVAPQLDIQNYISLIQAARRDKDIDRAFRVVDEMKANGVKVDIAAYSCVLDVCVLAGDMNRARSLVAQMREMGSLDVVAYNTLLKGYCNLGDSATAMALLSEMDAAGLQPNDVSFNCIINASAETGNFKKAWSLVEMMEKRGLKIDNFTMSILMKVLKKARCPHTKDVAKAFALLDRSGVDVLGDEILLNIVLQTCLRHRELTRLNTIFTKYLKSGHRPSLHIVGSLIKASGTLKRIETCREIWEDMVEQRRIAPNDYVLGYMLEALVSNDCVEEAIKLLNEWKNEVTPNSFLYSTILKGLANSDQSDRAMELYEEMKESGMPLNTFILTTLIDTQARLGATDRVSELVRVMKSMGCRPDDLTSSTIIKAYVIKGDIDEAYLVFQDMQKDGIAYDSVYDAILDGCIRINRMDVADLVIKDMENFNVKPTNSILGNLMKMYGRRRQVQKAFDVLEHLAKKHGLNPSTRVKICLMCTCLNNKEIRKAYEVFEDIKSRGQGVDAKAYNALIQANTKNGNTDEAARLVEEAYGFGKQRGLPSGQTLESDVIEQLLRALGRQGRTDSVGLPLFTKLRAAGVNINCRLFNTLVK